ncbi:hypothetical protein M422DRAFT_252011 [Sphaerobolus stellatus SS14]|uniref:Heme haloperoxidase family profile domain-containing protein n=1 Tax=Sphaerobolus stellatus (strain SS14) TaxID=990650 RepID=A0A0C9VCK8_SPHS4|nr:hypothetical protein M422DRAFT_252011 [Sphaerobolus stellatus SS14]
MTPAQIISAVQEGFNMRHDLVDFLTYAVFIVDDNPLTGLFSLGGKTPLTGPHPPQPVLAVDLKCDVSTKRVRLKVTFNAGYNSQIFLFTADAFFGDNHSFNETQFEGLVAFTNRFGGGVLNLTSAAEYRCQRIQESIAHNPNFSFVSPRVIGAYAETAFPLFFVDGRKADLHLPLDIAR